MQKTSPACAKQRLHVMQVVGEPVGGIRKHIHAIINGLDADRYQCSYAYSNVHVDARFQKEIQQIRHKLSVELILRVSKRPHPSDLVNLWRLIKAVKKYKIDIVHGHGAKGGLYARLVSRICGIKSIYTPHGGVVHAMFSPLEDWLYALIERWLFNKTDYFLFESRYTADAYQNKVGRKCERMAVNYNGIPAVDMASVRARAQLLEKQTTLDALLHVGVFGMLRPQKGQVYAIGAIEQLRNQGLKVKLHLFGEGADRPALQNMIRLKKLDGLVTFYGDVSDTEAHMYSMDVVLIPSLFESFGYVAVEALALGRPVVATSVGGLKEIIDNEVGLVVSAENEMDIVEAIEFVINHNDLIRDRVLKGQHKWRECFTESKMLAGVDAAYQEVSRPQ